MLNEATFHQIGKEPSMRVITSLLLALLALPLLASPADPSAALAQARAKIAKKEYREAAAGLTAAIDAARTIESRSTRIQALAALQFYCAVAYAGLGDDEQATAHLREFFAMTPAASAIDASRFDAHFVALFNGLLRKRQKTTEFDVYYPGFAEFAASEVKYSPPDPFGPNPALLILGTKTEQKSFESLTASTDRETFIENFWKRRDPTADTVENEFRDTFSRRSAFAEKVFGTLDSLGVMTDRGKVFILLGPPVTIRHSHLSQMQPYLYNNQRTADGEIEEWIYRADRLQLKLPKGPATFTYRFLTQEGIGDHVLLQRQDDFFPTRVLAAAGNPNGNP
jgi:GWxTD domain-containing protein